VISNLVRFGIQFLLLLGLMGWYALFKGIPIHFGTSWLLIPVLLIIMAGIGLGTGIIIAALTTKYRDFTVLLSFGVQLMMYATPVAYPLSYLASKSYKWVVTINPISPIIESFRYALFQRGTVTGLSYSIAFMVVSLFFGLMLFSKVEKTFMDTV
jgi:lipopolysaccharide transport system permease protein